MSTKHTPGPWKIFQTKGEPPFYVIGIGREKGGEGITDGGVGLGIWGADSPEAHANARLIAAAPDMLALLTECRKQIATIIEDGTPTDWPAWLADIDAAIAKAVGADERAVA